MGQKFKVDSSRWVCGGEDTNSPAFKLDNVISPFQMVHFIRESYKDIH